MQETPVRKRLRDYDYSQAGYYFITICVRDMQPLLGRVVTEQPGVSPTARKCSVGTEPSVGDGVLDVPKVQLSEYGKVAEAQIAAINEHYHHLTIEQHIVMPNHIHLLVRVYETDGGGRGTSRTPSPTNEAIPALVSTIKRMVNRTCGASLFQRGAHDHIVRNEAEYLKIWQYIEENPARWTKDVYYVAEANH